jgi:hypothetical protein
MAKFEDARIVLADMKIEDLPEGDPLAAGILQQPEDRGALSFPVHGARLRASPVVISVLHERSDLTNFGGEHQFRKRVLRPPKGAKALCVLQKGFAGMGN